VQSGEELYEICEKGREKVEGQIERGTEYFIIQDQRSKSSCQKCRVRPTKGLARLRLISGIGSRIGVRNKESTMVKGQIGSSLPFREESASAQQEERTSEA